MECLVSIFIQFQAVGNIEASLQQFLYQKKLTSQSKARFIISYSALTAHYQTSYIISMCNYKGKIHYPEICKNIKQAFFGYMKLCMSKKSVASMQFLWVGFFLKCLIVKRLEKNMMYELMYKYDINIKFLDKSVNGVH